MAEKSEISYPGTTADKWQIRDLADAYLKAATTLFLKCQKEDPLSYAPARLCSIHAIELYLNAFLRHEGVALSNIRARMHNLADPEFASQLKLRKKTAEHLATMTGKREYLIARYAPEATKEHSELNRLTVTLFEVCDKLHKYMSLSDTKGTA